jgi:transposase
MTIVVVFNPNLYEGQMQGIQGNFEKTLCKLNELQNRLKDRAEGRITKGRAPTETSVEKQVKACLSSEFMSDIFGYSMTNLNGIPYFTYTFLPDKLKELQETILGKTILFTNRHDWTSEEIASSYRSAWHVEHAFMQMKDKDHLTVRPLFHWTDQKIKVHIFYCILAFRLCCILMKELQTKCVNKYSLNHILDQMSNIKHVITVVGTTKRDILTSFSKGSALAESIAILYELKAKYLPN